ncbi:MAG: hypothetical protein ACPLQP_10040 [Moorellaceae bacterium]
MEKGNLGKNVCSRGADMCTIDIRTRRTRPVEARRKMWWRQG